MNNNISITPVILCGGSGTRLWPLSRASYPKQFLSLNPNDQKTLLQKTHERISNLPNSKNPILICNEEHRFIVAEQMRSINVEPQAILLEPFGRGTLSAITLAALKSLEEDKNSIILVLSSDHLIENDAIFVKSITKSVTKVLEGRLVTFGVRPTLPSTGYGYIKVNDKDLKRIDEGVNIENFIEKPNFKNANLIYKNPRYFWNSGIFIFKSKIFLKEIKKFEPNALENCSKALSKSIKDLDFDRVNEKYFEKCPNLSIDIAIFEKTKIGMMFPLKVKWDDIGSWDAFWDASKKDKYGNVIKGKVFTKEIKNSLIISENRLLVGMGIENLVIIETADAVLVTNKKNSQDVKNIVEELKKNNFEEAIEHRQMYRPWGHYKTIENEHDWKIKKIEINVGESISLQKHKFRSEHWIIIKGKAILEINNTIKEISENESAYVPLGCSHRLSNAGEQPLVLIEVQTGTYFGEDDIIRLEDKYKRVK